MERACKPCGHLGRRCKLFQRRIIHNRKAVKLLDVQKQAWHYWSDGTGAHNNYPPNNKNIIFISLDLLAIDRSLLYKCVCSETIAKGIEANIRNSLMKKLLLQKAKFQWMTMNGKVNNNAHGLVNNVNRIYTRGNKDKEGHKIGCRMIYNKN